MIDLHIFKKLILFCLLISCLSYGQENQTKNVIIINNDRLSMWLADIKVNDKRLHPGYQNCIVRQYTSDSIKITVPYFRLFFFTIKNKIFRFPLKDKNNYFFYTPLSLIHKLSVKHVTGDDLIKLKNKKYVKKKIKEFNLE
ncbi:hypothetical protein [Flavobacterium hercynium]|uniref:Uncharacterized protein n=1 Tax=Flavobacterium hercynium TaxID=387094 RepID=A0A226HFQ6_9FLAO|nr:hypothetical protein [Flavobacterium hercynium]OXA92944.1 hypothetical protein B0A66_09265 [Flavobacterium hercynium]SMP03491.1 hypothetical protein SAMN06265346_101291 [Flavobacterium hercynium]